MTVEISIFEDKQGNPIVNVRGDNVGDATSAYNKTVELVRPKVEDKKEKTQ